MDGQNLALSPQELYERLGTASSPLLLDVRPPDVFDRDEALIVGAIHQTPQWIAQWRGELPAGRQVVVYCGDGGDLSRRIALTLAQSGLRSAYLAEGMLGWRARHLPTRRKLPGVTNKWITRERPKIDRIACPWLIRRFIDPRAEFLYAPAADVLAVAAATGAVAFDIEGAAFAHEGERCSFDTILRRYGIADAALDRLARIVRGADTSRHDLAPQCGGLFAISLGLSANFADDHEMLAHGMIIYDALYVWCRSLQSETHNWPAKTASAA